MWGQWRQVSQRVEATLDQALTAKMRGSSVLNATPLEVGTIILKHLMQDDGGLGILARQTSRDSRTPHCTTRGSRQRRLLPLPMPLCCIGAWERVLNQNFERPAHEGKVGGNKRREALVTVAEDLWLGLMVLSLNFLETGCPSRDGARASTLSPHCGQRRALTRLRHRAAYCARGGADSSAREFGAPRTSIQCIVAICSSSPPSGHPRTRHIF